MKKTIILDYLHDDNMIKPLHIMLPNANLFVKSYDIMIVKRSGGIILLKMITQSKDIILFGINSELI